MTPRTLLTLLLLFTVGLSAARARPAKNVLLLIADDLNTDLG